ncbi:unnamed protein product [Camellia sinensis]
MCIDCMCVWCVAVCRVCGRERGGRVCVVVCVHGIGEREITVGVRAVLIIECMGCVCVFTGFVLFVLYGPCVCGREWQCVRCGHGAVSWLCWVCARVHGSAVCACVSGLCCSVCGVPLCVVPCVCCVNGVKNWCENGRERKRVGWSGFSPHPVLLSPFSCIKKLQLSQKIFLRERGR